jgi:multicomponent Na+:H+ antiporter subunit F
VILQTTTWLFILPIIAVSVALVFIRLIQGPSLSDRIVALDLIGSLSIGFIAVYAIASGEAVYLDVAAVVALISFLGTIAFAYYVEKRV